MPTSHHRPLLTILPPKVLTRLCGCRVKRSLLARTPTEIQQIVKKQREKPRLSKLSGLPTIFDGRPLYLEERLVIAPCLQFLRRVLPLADLKGSGESQGHLLVQLPRKPKHHRHLPYTCRNLGSRLGS